MNGVQTRLKCKPNVKRCKRFVFAAHSPLLHPNTLKTKAIIHFQTDHILTRFVFPPLFAYYKVNESEYLEYKRQQLSGQKQHEENNVELILSDGSIYSHKGTLETVEGDFERGTGSIAFRVRFPNPDGLLKHGVTGKVRMMTQMDNICLVPQKSTFEIQDFTYVYTVDSASVVKVRSFQPLERYNNYYVTQDFSPNTAIVYEGVQMMKDGITIKTDTIDMEAIRKEVELKQPIVK